jgi:hypothetical protein
MVTVQLPLEGIGLGTHTHYRMTNLWDDTIETIEASALTALSIAVPRDKIAGGGLALVKIEATA